MIREKAICDLGIIFSELEKWGEAERQSSPNGSDSQEACAAVCTGSRFVGKMENVKDGYIRTEGHP